jgi:CDP-4-dehydro-6-deoxyglucose reductase
MSYTVTLLPSNISFVCESDESILDGALRNDYIIPYGCQGGSCGACSVQVVSGNFNYPDGDPNGITAADKAANKAFLCQAHAVSDITLEVNVEEGIAKSKILPVKVVEKNQLTHDIVQLILKLPEGETLDFQAGQYIDFLLKDNKKRSFSLASPSNKENTLELQIRHVDDGYFTDIVFNKMNVDEMMRIEGPLGTFYLRSDRKRPIIMMGGGTGFAPLKGMIEQAINENLALDIHLFWGVRAEKDLYMLDLIDQWSQKLPNFKFTPVLSEPDEADGWQGKVGFVHEAVIEAYKDLSDHDLYMCGPPVMIEASRNAVTAKGLNQDNMFSDSFDFQA